MEAPMRLSNSYKSSVIEAQESGCVGRGSLASIVDNSSCESVCGSSRCASIDVVQEGASARSSDCKVVLGIQEGGPKVRAPGTIRRLQGSRIRRL